MPENKDIFLDFIKTRDLPERAVEQFEYYEQLIQEKNKKFNLVSENTLQIIWTLHFLDSLLITDYFDFKNSRVLDFGSGAGFPGIPLKIMYPDIELYCIESIRKKALFLTLLKTELNLTDMSVLNMRFEEIHSALHGTFDFIVVRAVRMTDEYLYDAFKLLKPAGKIILYKSTVIDDEVDKIKRYTDCASTEIIGKKISGLGKRAFIIAEKHG